MANSTSPQSTPTSISLPGGLSADSIDTLPVLAAILSRLQALSPTNASASSPPATTPSALASGTGAIPIKDIPAATDSLKHKIQKARAQVTQLPDMQRSVAEQELELRELEERIKSQRAVLDGLRAAGLAAKAERMNQGDSMEM
ncbi:hypothetical protein BP5796_07269 [Coleophoma crateriformis]|uniref:Mediator of RNA polymerase II transcription subunit 9 n=1 Tax=Coleophoma crateriformis TaxID=565419 RepID=A0A3D8RIF7_9HELO|nr:hypothetical protein BP5796_07269 [Coleophoma crateriformis]